MKVVQFDAIVCVLCVVMVNSASSIGYNPVHTIEHFCHTYKPYQDIVINGDVVFQGWNTHYCSNRYDILATFLEKQYQKALRFDHFIKRCANSQLTMLDLGAAQGYFSLRCAHDFGVTCVMIEDGNSATELGHEAISFLIDLCRSNREVASNIFLLQTTVSSRTLNLLRHNDHFDIVLALSVLHYLPDWQYCIDVLLKLGDTIIIELPDPYHGDLSEMINAEKLIDMHNYIVQKNGKVFAESSRFYKGQTSIFYVLEGVITRSASYIKHTRGISSESFYELNGKWPELFH